MSWKERRQRCARRDAPPAVKVLHTSRSNGEPPKGRGPATDHQAFRRGNLTESVQTARVDEEDQNEGAVVRAIVQQIEINPTAVTIVTRFSAATPISIGRTVLSTRLPQA